MFNICNNKKYVFTKPSHNWSENRFISFPRTLAQSETNSSIQDLNSDRQFHIDNCYTKCWHESMYLPDPFPTGMVWHKVNFLNGVTHVWIQSFPSPKPVTIIKLITPVFLLIYPKLVGRIDGFMPFQRVLTLFEIEAALFRIWTWVMGPIFFDINHYTPSTSLVHVSVSCSQKSKPSSMVAI